MGLPGLIHDFLLVFLGLGLILGGLGVVLLPNPILKPRVKSIIYYLPIASERQSGKGTD